MINLRFFANPGIAKTMIQNFSSLAGVTGARLQATNALNQTSTISGGAQVVGNNIYITIPASYNTIENYPAVFVVETTTNGTTWTPVLTLYGVIRVLTSVPTIPESDGITIATAFNKTGTVTTFAANPSNSHIPGLVIFVPPTTKDVWVHWGYTVGITTAGGGYVLGKLYDITDGGATYLEASLSRIESSRVATSAAEVCRGSCRVGPSTTSRQYGLYGSILLDASSPLVAYARNFAGSVSNSWLRAVG